MTHQLVLIRHGQTEWARDGRHTGRTDVPLTPTGEQQARDLAPLLEPYRGCPVLVSPLQRASRTAELAGLGDAVVEPELVEWDYGAYEGLTTPEIRELAGPSWTVFADGVVPGDSPGESLEDVARRARAVLGRVRPLMTDSDVVLVGHGHQLRILASCWLEAPPAFGARLLLSPASLSVLGEQHDVPAIVGWNVAAQD
ncbi:histidine phosphatase family protein [Angustibacter sp. Root456]|uniref:histidine phosphatase family protein n=1 Tax=Angustibacter sp. Root456 TaxID=1736539 RepID=UPI0006FB7841|nr:histidine phosphatase family protein [Angustibacter sp. Root456]KQX66495.1 phosphoglycerate mutase [Angustibacter sp. Root456]